MLALPNIDDIPLEQLPIGESFIVGQVTTNKGQLSLLPLNYLAISIDYMERNIKGRLGDSFEFITHTEYLPHLDEYVVRFYIKRVK